MAYHVALLQAIFLDMGSCCQASTMRPMSEAESADLFAHLQGEWAMHKTPMVGSAWESAVISGTAVSFSGRDPLGMTKRGRDTLQFSIDDTQNQIYLSRSGTKLISADWQSGQVQIQMATGAHYTMTRI